MVHSSHDDVLHRSVHSFKKKLATVIGLSLVVPVAAGFALAGFPQQTLAQVSASATLYDWSIPAGSLESALNQAGRQAGILLSFPTSLVAGKSSPGVQGSLSLQAALDRLLAGSGLVAERNAQGQYQLRETGNVLPAVRVDSGALGDVTEHSGNYTTGAMSTATGLALSPRETPQSVSVLTRAQIDDQNLLTLDDAVQHITGLTMQKGYFSGDSGSFSARGFPVANLLLDGVPTTTGANGTFNADNDALDIYDRVEVVRGATGLTTGAGTPSAAINLVRKRPTAETQGSLTASAGSWNNYRGMLDWGGSVNNSGSLRGRVVTTLQDSDKYYDTAHDRNQQFYGIVEADLTSDTLATLGFHYRKVDNDGLLPNLPTNADGTFLEGLSRSANFNNDFDYWKQTDKTVFAELTHRFAGGWQAKGAAVWKRPEQDLVFSGAGRTAGVLRQNTQSYRMDNEQDSYELSVSGPFSLSGRSHELMMGSSYRTRYNNNWGGWADWSWTAAAPEIDPWHWDSSVVIRPDIDMSLWRQVNTTRQKGVYVATRLNLADPLKLILGSRLSWYEREQGGGFGSGFKIDREITPYAGLVYDINSSHSVYASWTEIFEPQASTDRNGAQLDPITGTNYEVGIKGEYLDGRLNANLAAFLIQQQNRATNDLTGPNPCPGSTWGYCQRASGEVESKGVEFEISGQLTPDWLLTAGYTYVDAKYTKDSDAANIGKLFDSDLPGNQFKLSTSYRLPGHFNRWRVGGNVYVQNDIQSSDDDRIRQAGYAIFGLNAAWNPTEKLDVRLNINNLFDKHYYQNIGWATGGNVFGAPRNFTLTGRYNF